MSTLRMRRLFAVLALLLVARPTAAQPLLPDRPFSGAAVAGPLAITRYDIYVEAVMTAASQGYAFAVTPNHALLIDALRSRLTRAAILDAAKARGDIVATSGDRAHLRKLLLRAYGDDVRRFTARTGISEARLEAEVRDRALAQAWVRTLAAAPAGDDRALERLDRVREAIDRARSRYFTQHPIEILDPDLAGALPFPELASE